MMLRQNRALFSRSGARSAHKKNQIIKQNIYKFSDIKTCLAVKLFNIMFNAFSALFNIVRESAVCNCQFVGLAGTSRKIHRWLFNEQCSLKAPYCKFLKVLLKAPPNWKILLHRNLSSQYSSRQPPHNAANESSNLFNKTGLVLVIFFSIIYLRKTAALFILKLGNFCSAESAQRTLLTRF